jgi:hypothetical protein
MMTTHNNSSHPGVLGAKWRPNNARGGWSRLLHSGKWDMVQQRSSGGKHDVRKNA